MGSKMAIKEFILQHKYMYIYKYIFLTFHSKPFDKTEDNIFSSMAFKKKLIKGLFVRDVNKIVT